MIIITNRKNDKASSFKDSVLGLTKKGSTGLRVVMTDLDVARRGLCKEIELGYRCATHLAVRVRARRGCWAGLLVRACFHGQGFVGIGLMYVVKTVL